MQFVTADMKSEVHLDLAENSRMVCRVIIISKSTSIVVLTDCTWDLSKFDVFYGKGGRPIAAESHDVTLH